MSYKLTQTIVNRAIANHVEIYDGLYTVAANHTFSTGSTITFKIISGENYKFSGEGVRAKYYDPNMGDYSYLNGTLSSGDTVCQIPINSSIVNGTDFLITTVEATPEPVLLYTLSGADLNELIDNEITVSINGNVVDTDIKFYVGDLVSYNIISSNRTFLKDPDFKGAVYYRGYSPDYGDNINITFDMSEDFKTASKAFTEVELGMSSFTQHILTEIETPQVLASNNVYSIDDSILKAVNKVRIYKEGDNFIDYGSYILSVLQLPFNLPPELIAGSADIVLGDVNTTVTADTLNTDKVTFNLGSINVVSENNNLLDYINTSAILHLPYVQSKNIDLEYVIDCELTINYILDVYTGSADVNIDSIKDGVLTNISSDKVDIGVNVPFMNIQTFGDIKGSDIVVGGFNGVTKAYIEMVRDLPTELETFFSSPIKDNGVLNLESGYIVVDNINLNGIKYKSDLDSLNSILSNGVIIN